MLRIVICGENTETASLLFGEMRAILEKTSVKCELTKVTDLSLVRENLSKDIKYYDILVLDGVNEECLKIAGGLRKRNLIASVVFTVPADFDAKLLAKFRPTAYITDTSDLRQVYDALKYTCNEQNRAKTYITVKNKGELIRVSFSDIYYFESRLRIVALYTKTQVIEFYGKLSELLPLLPEDTFVKCHQSYIVNLEEVILLDRTNRLLRFPNGSEVEISKSNYAATVAKYTAIR